jgi:glycine/D-amino acid oxidase-like deaminating enzyme
VNAAGAWAQEVGRVAGGLDLPLRPLRRHLAWSAGPFPPGLPWAWWADRPFYVRPESGGALLCPCDEGAVAPPARGCQTETDAAVLAALAALARELAPGLGAAAFARSWSGLRTFAPDRRFVLGPDPRNPRLHWAAGLGGHGMTSGLAVGRLVAEGILGGADPGVLAARRFEPIAPMLPG